MNVVRKPENPERPEPPEPASVTNAKTFGEALDEMGFVPLDPPKRIIVRECHAQEPLTRWRKPKGRD
jgi:hypothetical protein